MPQHKALVGPHTTHTSPTRYHPIPSQDGFFSGRAYRSSSRESREREQNREIGRGQVAGSKPSKGSTIKHAIRSPLLSFPHPRRNPKDAKRHYTDMQCPPAGKRHDSDANAKTTTKAMGQTGLHQGTWVQE
ncbi:uncharacterized protein MONBRDRAFT_38720 [Monosiga brevicollis MX1]|uniref:Uncharacterized protein n=1 Tax=Monosiga brevicollis TaxID=81824 RepID=A9V9Q3_MONBE|nr:uncharacterized protein MONBRDRAFT_38720 [Monosiga brevicollis MX1]EDQ85707.1 predicted protein [Monosiga brevicollis MX1]|eukprot:XP_001749422.1 hypothetical protein [Monosiga brevicollis MX1]